MDVMVGIPARGGSKGVPRKNLRLVGGVPLVGLAVRVGLATAASRVCVSTDDDEIASVAKAHGAEVIHRPVELAVDTAATLSVLRHAVESSDVRPDVVVCLQCTAPLTVPDDITHCVALLDGGRYDVAIACHQTNAVVLSGRGKPVNVTMPIRRRQDREPQYAIAGSVFAFRADYLTRTTDVTEGEVAIHAIPRSRAIDIDTHYDLWLAERMRRYGNRWACVGSSTSAAKWLPVVLAENPGICTITTNKGIELFPNRPPEFYWLSDSTACRRYSAIAAERQSEGMQLVTFRRDAGALVSRGVENANIFLPHDRPAVANVFTRGEYPQPSISGLVLLQFAVNHGAKELHLVGMEGYRDGPGKDAPNYFDGTGHSIHKQHTEKIIRPFIQSMIDVCLDVEFIFYGNMNFRVGGPNVRFNTGVPE